MRIENAKESDKNELLALYHSVIHGPAHWDETYPSMQTIEFDLSRESLYVMRDDSGSIVAAISIDKDDLVEELPCWSSDLKPCAEVSRICVRKDMQNRGIVGQMLHHVFGILKTQGKRSIHLLVVRDHEFAVAAYTRAGFEKVGECQLYDEDFLCMEKAL